MIPELQNFLKTSPLTLHNLPIGEDGVVTFKANLKPYTQLYILALDLNSVAQRQVDLEAEPTAKRDLSLMQCLSASDNTKKGFTESRTTVELIKGETHQIEDITSTEIQLIDDLKKVKGVLEELMRTNYQLSSAEAFREMSPVFIRWPQIETDEEKTKLFYKHFSHEFNAFLKLKDPRFFDKVVRPFLACKMEKQFVDLYLLDDHATLAKTYNTLERLSKLNAFEKCLLVDSLVQVGDSEGAKRLVNHIRVYKESQEYVNVEANNKIFDIVLNLNMLKAEGANGAAAGDQALFGMAAGALGG
jgi:hypothetical protein